MKYIRINDVGRESPTDSFVGLNVIVTYYIYKELNIMFEEFNHFFRKNERSSYKHRGFVDGVENSTVEKVKYTNDLAIAYIGLSKPLVGKIIDMKKRKYRLYFSPMVGIAALYGCDMKKYIGNIPKTSIDAIIFKDLHSGRYDLSTGCVPDTTVIIVSPSDRKKKEITSTEYVYKIDMSQYKNNIYMDTQLQSSDIYMLKDVNKVPVMLNSDGSPDVIRHRTKRTVLYRTPEEYKGYRGTNMSFFNEFAEFICDELIFQEYHHKGIERMILEEVRKPRQTQESVLPSKERNKLDDSDFGIPETRSYPIHDKSHVEAAVRMFPNAPLKYRKSLAKRILRKAHEFNMDTSNWKSLNKYTGSD